jgi:predicted HD phosphohydrolase
MSVTSTIGTTVDEVLALVDELDELTYGVVDLRTHALRCARLALTAGADDALVVAALLHDIGRVRYLAKAAPGVAHEEVGRRFVEERFGARTGWLVGAHVVAKRYLATVDEDYLAGLARPLKSSLKRQGGLLSEAEVARFEQHPAAGDAVTLRRWDDLAATATDLATAAVRDVAPALSRAWIG